MTTIGAASASSPVFQAQPSAAPPKKVGQDNDGDEGPGPATTKAAEAGSSNGHKLDIQA
jgi:hypothetical protein